MSPIVSERCVVVYPSGATGPPSSEVFALARALAPYLALKPADVQDALRRCGVDTRRRVTAR